MGGNSGAFLLDASLAHLIIDKICYQYQSVRGIRAARPFVESLSDPMPLNLCRALQGTFGPSTKCFILSIVKTTRAVGKEFETENLQHGKVGF
jgi:hypothetical protein